MNFIAIYQSNIENFNLMAGFICFLIFLITAIMFKTASGVNSYTKLNSLHKKISLLYYLVSLGLALYTKDLNILFITSFLLGLFVYYSLHYVYLFSLIGLAKKSISINILFCIEELSRSGVKVNEDTLNQLMNTKKLGFESLRKNRLEQMLLLNFASMKNNQFHITKKGSFTNKTGVLILKIWNQVRL